MRSKSLIALGVAVALIVLAGGIGNAIPLASAQSFVGSVSMFTNKRHYRIGETVYLTIITPRRLRNVQLSIMNPDGRDSWRRLDRLSPGMHMLTFFAAPPAGLTRFALFADGNFAASTQVFVGW